MHPLLKFDTNWLLRLVYELIGLVIAGFLQPSILHFRVYSYRLQKLTVIPGQPQKVQPILAIFAPMVLEAMDTSGIFD